MPKGPALSQQQMLWDYCCLPSLREIFFKNHLLYFISFYMRGCFSPACISMHHIHAVSQRSERECDTMELELQTRCTVTWLQGIKLGPLQEQSMLLNQWVTSSATDKIFLTSEPLFKLAVNIHVAVFDRLKKMFLQNWFFFKGLQLSMSLNTWHNHFLSRKTSSG